MRPRSSLALRMFPLLIVLVGAAAPAVSEQHKSQILAQAPSTVLELRRDVVILRSGTREQGVLTGCSSTSCSLDGKSHRRDDIFLIGLGVVSPDVPPLIEDPLQDSVHLRDASVLKARVLGINTQTVATAQGSRTRKDVSWVYLAPPQPSAPKSDARPRPPAKDKAKETRDAPRPAPPSGDETVKTAERWIGEAYWTWKVTPDHLIVSTAKIRLRVGDTGASNELLHDGSTIHVKHETLGGDCIFRGQGTSPAEGTAGFIIRPQEVVGPAGERRMDPWTYTLFLTPARDPTWTVTCEGVDGPYTHTHGGAAGLSQAFVGAHDDDPEIVRVFDLQSGRMEGSYRVPGKYEKTVRWSICREGVTCPPLERDDPTPPPGANKCSLPRNLRAMLALALAEQHALQPKTDDKSLNELRNKSIEVDQLTEQYRSACLDYANCMGMPTGMCETIPPQTKAASPKGSKSPRSAPAAGGGGFVRP